MRLMHAGYEVSVVGEIVTPAITEGDLLIAISGSGETEQLIAFTKRARSFGASIVLLTAKQNSTIRELADEVFQIGAPEVYATVIGMPMGTVFELSTLCFLEALVSHIIWEKGVPEEEMKTRHANLELRRITGRSVCSNCPGDRVACSRRVRSGCPEQCGRGRPSNGSAGPDTCR